MTSLDAEFERLHSPKQELLNSMQASSEGEVMKQPASRHYGFAQPAVVDLKRKSVIGGIAAVSAQGVKFFLQMATTMCWRGCYHRKILDCRELRGSSDPAWHFLSYHHGGIKRYVGQDISADDEFCYHLGFLSKIFSS